jgi:hypothetical protein
VGRIRHTQNALILALAIVMAWPWNIAFSALEAALDSPPVSANLVGRTGEHSHLERPGRVARWNAADEPSPSLLFDDAEEEADDDGLVAQPSVLCLSPIALRALTSAERSEPPAITSRNLGRAISVHLRC